MELVTLEKFKSVISDMQKVSDRSLDLTRNYQIDLINFEDDYHRIIDNLFSMVFNEEQYDMVNWWIYELDYGKQWTDNSIKNINGEPIIVDTVENLYNYLTTLK